MMTDPFFRGLRGVFTDVDGTLTTDGKLTPSTYEALAELRRSKRKVVVVTGRPAGWADAFARLWPVDGAIAENGGVLFLPDGCKELAVPAATLPATRRRMHAAARALAKRVPGARLSKDSIYTEVNLAVDWNEDVHLPETAAKEIEAYLRKRGFNAVRSSVHVNFWPGGFDKLTACRRMIRALGGAAKDYLYVGDALNDEPMFRGFPRSVAVANIRRVWDELTHKPARVTRAAEGAGFEELVRAILK